MGRERMIEEEDTTMVGVGEGVYLVEGAEELREDGRFRGREGRLGEMNGREVVIRRKDISVGVCVFEREGNGERRRLVVEERGEIDVQEGEGVRGREVKNLWTCVYLLLVLLCVCIHE